MFNNNGRRPNFSRSSSFNRGGGNRRRFGGGSRINPARYISTVLTAAETPMEIPVTHTFADFGLDPRLVSNVTKHGYDVPTPIQDQGIPLMMEGRDLVGIANTGTGKTAAFLLPLLHKVLQDDKQGVLIIVPTRELATQISDEFTIFAKGLPVGMCVCVGGMNIMTQIRNLRRNPHFVIATPGRLKDLIERRNFDPNLFTNIVLDEVDRMLDIGFVRDIQYIVGLLPKDRSAYFFSATMNREAEGVMRQFAHDPATVVVSSPATYSHIHQDVVRVPHGKTKMEVLFDLLVQKEFERVMVFGATKHGIDRMETELLNRGLKVQSMHGNKNQSARQRALTDFKTGRVQVLLATDVAARGIDVEGVTHVINYDEPNNYQDYTHRIGRTGRAGKMGKALTFVAGY